MVTSMVRGKKKNHQGDEGFIRRRKSRIRVIFHKKSRNMGNKQRKLDLAFKIYKYIDL